MSLLLTKLQDFLHRATNEGVSAQDGTTTEFTDACNAAIKDKFNGPRTKRKFSINMSSIGKPLCQLQAEKYNFPKETKEYIKIKSDNNIITLPYHRIKKIKEARAKQITPLQDTKIEIKMQDLLKQLKIKFQTHKYMKEIEHAYQCDIFIPKM
ncbi:hypothetical protein LCGC14_3100690, partial [marine sediment metagenome]